MNRTKDRNIAKTEVDFQHHNLIPGSMAYVDKILSFGLVVYDENKKEKNEDYSDKICSFYDYMYYLM